MLVAVFALVAIAAASASASGPVWWVNGAKLAEGAKKEFTGKNISETIKLVIPSSGGAAALEIQCQEQGAGSIAGIKNGTATLDLTKCRVEVPAGSGCAVWEATTGTGTINFKELQVELVWSEKTGKKVMALLKGKGTSLEWGEPEIEGCQGTAEFWDGSLRINGEALAEILPVGQEAITGHLLLPSPRVLKYWTGDEPGRTEHSLGHSLGWLGLTAEVFGESTMELTSKETFGALAA